MLGTDPEVFVVEAKTGRAVSAHHFFPFKGSKIQVGKHGGVKIFRDGFALETNVDPSPLPNFFPKYLAAGYRKAEMVIGREHRLLAQSTVKMDPHEMKDAPEDMKSFGCDPSYDAYALAVKRPDIDALVHPERYAGCHIHYSNEKASFLKNKKLVPLAAKMCDLFVGLPTTWITAGEPVFARRQYYGQAGEFRIQSYPDGTEGFEYRTPGSEILQNEMIFTWALRTVQYILDRFDVIAERWDKTMERPMQKAINTGKGLDASLLPQIEGITTMQIYEKFRKAFLSSAGNGQPFAG